jgi:hypothetical protein
MPSPAPSWLTSFFETGVAPSAAEEEEEEQQQQQEQEEEDEVCSHHASAWMNSILNTL